MIVSCDYLSLYYKFIFYVYECVSDIDGVCYYYYCYYFFYDVICVNCDVCE